MGMLIKNGRIITSDSDYVADIWCEEETITQIASHIDPPKNAEIIDATNKFVFPGFIDPHTHVYLPAMGTFAKDNYETASIAALCGGTTTFFDFPSPERNEEPLKAVETWHKQAQGNSCCDYAFHLCITRFNTQVEQQLRKAIENGITSFKIFLAYKESLGISDGEIYKVLKFSKETGTIVCAHCENADVIEERQKHLIHNQCTEPKYHYESRPPIVEEDGTKRFCIMAECLNVPVYIVHLSCEESLRAAMEVKMRGLKAWIEVVVSHLLLDKTYSERPGLEGAKYIISPPLRDKKNHPVLWNALESGLISVVSTDHAPFDTNQKLAGKDNFCCIPNGMPSIEDRIRLLYSYGVCQKRLDIHRFVEIASTQAAKIFGLFPKKGTIQLGSDADLVVYDPNYKEIITAKNHHMNIDYSAFEGFPVQGRCDAVTVRGKIQVRNGQFVGEKGFGKFIHRKPNL